MDLGDPVSYLVVTDGAPVLSADGAEVGRLEHVLADDGADVFDGVILETADGHRFADAEQVEALYERGVVLTLDADAAQRLPEPSENPAALGTDPADTTPDGLSDKLRRAWDYLSGNY